MGETLRVGIAGLGTVGTGVVRIVQGRVSLSTVSGPITLYDIAGDAACVFGYSSGAVLGS